MLVIASKCSGTFSVETRRFKSRNPVHVLIKVPSSLKRQLLIRLICDCLKILIQIIKKKPRSIVFKFEYCLYLIKEITHFGIIWYLTNCALLYPYLKCPKTEF